MQARSVCLWTLRLSLGLSGSLTSVHDLKCMRTQTTSLFNAPRGRQGNRGEIPFPRIHRVVWLSRQPKNQPLYPSLPITVSVSAFICLCLCLSVCLSLFLSLPLPLPPPLFSPSLNVFSFLHSIIFIDWMYSNCWGREIPGCLSVCLSVCLCVSVCLFAL